MSDDIEARRDERPTGKLRFVCSKTSDREHLQQEWEVVIYNSADNPVRAFFEWRSVPHVIVDSPDPGHRFVFSQTRYGTGHQS